MAYENFEYYLKMKMKRLMLKPFKYWRAYTVDIIDENGNKLREPEGSELLWYNIFDELIRKIKFFLMKYTPNKGFARYELMKKFMEGFVDTAFETFINKDNLEPVVEEAVIEKKVGEFVSGENTINIKVDYDSPDEKYNRYLAEHIGNVKKAYTDIILKNNKLTNYLNADSDICKNCINSHDSSKFDPVEFYPYRDYFYGGEKTKEVIDNFNRAWLRHIHKNPHHWQHWVLNYDDGSVILIKMPDNYIVELLCDWLSFSIKSNNINEIKEFYNKNKSNYKFEYVTREKIETAIKMITEGV